MRAITPMAFALTRARAHPGAVRCSASVVLRGRTGVDCFAMTCFSVDPMMFCVFASRPTRHAPVLFQRLLRFPRFAVWPRVSPVPSIARLLALRATGMIALASFAHVARAEAAEDFAHKAPVLGPASTSEPVREGPAAWSLTSCHPAIGTNSWPLTSLAVEFDPAEHPRDVQLRTEDGTMWSLTAPRPAHDPNATRASHPSHASHMPVATQPPAAATWWVALPTPQFTSCVTLLWTARRIAVRAVSSSGSTLTKPLPPPVHSAHWYTDLDEGEPAQKFLHALRTWPNWHAHAPPVLGAVQAPYRAMFVQAIEAQWTSLSPREQERGMLAYERWAAHDEAARAALAALAIDDRSPHARRAVTALLHAGPVSSEELLRVAARRPSLWARLNAPLARHAPEATLRTLWATLEEPPTRQVPAARRGLLLATQELHAQTQHASGHVKVETMWAGWLTTQPSLAAVAFAAEAFNGSRTWLSLQQQLLDYAVPKATLPHSRFEDRWRLLLAIRSMPSIARYDGWVAEQALHAPEWMTRNAALETLREHARPAAHRTASTLLQDPYPRVQITAAAMLHKHIDAPSLPFLTIEPNRTPTTTPTTTPSRPPKPRPR
jgi:hypothetical protein